jgi:hypothetical protein
MLQEDCAIFLLFDPNAAQRYEKLPNPISNEQTEELIERYQPLYSEDGNYLILEETCPMDVSGQ